MRKARVVSLFDGKSKGAHGLLFRLYDSRHPPEPEYPNVDPSVADFTVDEDSEFYELQEEVDEERWVETELAHAPPGLVPCHLSPWQKPSG